MSRVERARLSIAEGNAIQAALLIVGVALLWACAQPGAPVVRATAMLGGYLLIYFSTHAPAHWLIGRLFGIHFTHYSVGGSTHASAYPPGMRQVFASLPFFAVHADRASLRSAPGVARGLMFGAGMTSSILCCSLVAIWCSNADVPGGRLLLVANCAWFLGALIAEFRTRGDYAKAAKALRS